MAIAHVVSSGLLAYADTVAPYANQTTPTPGGTAGDLVLAVFGIKPYSTSIADPTDYIACGNKTSGTTAEGNGTGSMRVQAYWKLHDGSESSVTGVYDGTYNPTMNAINAFSNTTNLWSVESTDGAQESTPNVSITGAAQLDFAPGDWIVVVHVTNDNTALPTGVTITVPGCVVGTVSELLPTNATATGNDGSMSVYKAEITSGNASGAPTFAGSGANSIGPALFIRLHEVTEFTAAVAVAGTGTIATVGEIPAGGTTFERTAAIAGTSSIATAGSFWSTFERTLAVGGTGGIASSGHRILERLSAVAGTSGISVSGGVVGGVTVYERTAAIAGSGGIATVGSFWSTFERAAALTGTGGIASSGHSILERVAAVAGTSGIATSGLSILERAAAIAGVGGLAVTGARTVDAAVGVAGTGAVTVGSFVRELLRAVSIDGVGSISSDTKVFRDASTWVQSFGFDWVEDEGPTWAETQGNAWDSAAQDGWS